MFVEGSDGTMTSPHVLRVRSMSQYDTGSIRGFRAPSSRYESEAEDTGASEGRNDSDDEHQATYSAYMAQARPRSSSIPSVSSQRQVHSSLSNAEIDESGLPVFGGEDPRGKQSDVQDGVADSSTFSASSRKASSTTKRDKNKGHEREQVSENPLQEATSTSDRAELHTIEVQRHSPTSLGFGVRGIRDPSGQVCCYFLGHMIVVVQVDYK